MHPLCPKCGQSIDVTDAGATLICSACGVQTLPLGQGKQSPGLLMPSPAPAAGPTADEEEAPVTVAPAGPTTTAARAGVPAGYELLGELGRGGMGVVYKARHVKLNRLVALKMILSGSHAGEEETARFRTEAEAVARLQHPGIVAIHEVGEHEGLPFFSLEFCPGGTLDRKLHGTPLEPAAAATLVKRLARAVQHAHEHGIVHRDLKPANVLLTEDDVAKITDFGLAKKLDEQGHTQTGSIMGTPSYMPPEQARGDKDVGPLADVYALGAILYECLTGRPPFKAATPLDTLAQVVKEEPVAPTRLNARVPRELETVCLKCLRKEPQKRYASAKEVGDDLGRHLAGEPIRGRPVGLMERGEKWVRRNPAVAALLLLVLLTFATGAAVATAFGFLEKKARVEAERAAQERGEALSLARAEEKKANDARAREEKARQQAEENEKRAKAARDEADEQTKAAKMGRHGFMMTAAWQAWQQNDVTTAEAVLREVPPQLRQTWEYRHVHGLCQRKAMALEGHTGEVRAVAYSPDGCCIATAGADRTLRVWDARTGQGLLSLDGRAGLSAVAFGNGGLLASGGDDGVVRVWEARTGRELLTLKGHAEGVSGVAFSPGGERVVACCLDKTVRVWDARSGERLLTLRASGGVLAVAYSPDGTRLASASRDGTLEVWDARSGERLLALRGHAEGVSAVAYSPDGFCLASGCLDRTVRVWDARSGELLLTLRGATDSVFAVAYSTDGSRLASGCLDRTVRVWDAHTGQRLLTLRGHLEGVAAVAFSPDGCYVTSGGWDGRPRVWDARTGQEELLVSRVHEFGVSAVAYSPDGSCIASGGADSALKVRDARTGQEVLTLEGHVHSVPAVAYSPDGLQIVSASRDTTVRVWDARTGRGLLKLDGLAGVSAVAFGPGGRVAAGGDDRVVRVWDAGTGKESPPLEGHKGGTFALAFGPGGSRLASGGDDKLVLVWEVGTGKRPLALTGHTEGVDAVAFGRDGTRIASASRDGTLKVWDANSGEELLTLRGHLGAVSAVAYSPDGKRIASGSADKTLKLWDAETGQELLTLEGHTAGVSAVAFSPDGFHLASGSRDETLRVWSAAAPDAWRRDPEEARVGAILRAGRERKHHDAEAERMGRIDPFGAVFHLDRLLALSPGERHALLERRTAVLSAALAKDANDHHSARSFARQAVADPGTVPDPKALLAAVARQQHAPSDRLHGALLLRTGNARDAAVVLRAAIRHRHPDQPPIDELLLALALMKLDRRDEARQYLTKAAAWMDNGTAPQRVAALLVARPAGPLASLAAVAFVPDVRLNPLDPFTAHELYALRREAEQALAGR